MRRSVLAAIGTVAGTALMLGAKLSVPPANATGVATVSDNGAVAGAPPGDPNLGAAAGSGAAAGPAQSGPAALAGNAMNTAAGSPPTTVGGGTTMAPQPLPATGGRKDGVFTGSAAIQPYGYTVSVTIKISGGRITAAAGS